MLISSLQLTLEVEAGAKAEAEAVRASTQAAENFMVTGVLKDMNVRWRAKRLVTHDEAGRKIEVDVRGYATRKTRHLITSVRHPLYRNIVEP